MSIVIYNTLTRKKEKFEPLSAGKVGIYLCGPTVYKPSHIGHAVGPIIFDTIARYLKYKGFEVRLVVNITDVEDKLIDQAREQGREMLDIARQVEADYKTCLDALGVRNVTDFPRATEHMQDIIDLIQRMVDKSSAYVIDSDVYFDHRACKDYGKLSGRKIEDAMSGTRTLQGKAKHHADFALWKSAQADEPAWDSPWGRGRPGWHIECSAMSIKMLGETFDIHGGGMDLIFPHHENEIAQSETATGKPFAKYWMHNGLTRMRTKTASGELKNEKMSKSLGNIRTISSLLEDYSGQTIRAFVLSTHYRRPLDFSDEQLDATARRLKKYYQLFEQIERLAGVDLYSLTDGAYPSNTLALEGLSVRNSQAVEKARDKFFAAMDNDFNTAAALAALEGLRKTAQALVDCNLPTEAGKAGEVLMQLAHLLGLFETRVQISERKIDPGQIDKLIAQRRQAREAKDFGLSDQIRDQLAAMGVEIMDTSDGTTWRKS